jgi:phosphate transport system permease protein
MVLILLFALILLISRLVKRKAVAFREKSGVKNSSLPIYYSYCYILWSLIAILSVFLLDLSDFIAFFSIILVFFATNALYKKNFNAKNHLEFSLRSLMFTTALIGILITIAITASIFFESVRFFEKVNFFDFLFGLQWNPQMAIHEGQSVAKSHFGMVPVLLGTILITAVAMSVSIPLGIMAAIYLCFYSSSKVRDILKPVLEILAGVPTVVYGFFAVSFVAPFFKSSFAIFGVNIASESALAAGFVMGIMIIPFILSLTDDALNAVPSYLKDGALALGSTKSEMIKKVVVPSAMPSIISAVILAFSRAIGETMIVVMSAGLVANLTFNPLNAVTTATAQIVTLLVGDQEFDSPKTLAAFALALVLFVITFAFNVIALMMTKKYRK